jgi:hypothetical protein
MLCVPWPRYNFFLAMPIICVGMFDRDIGPSTVERFRWTYMSGRENMDLNVRNMALWLVQVSTPNRLASLMVNRRPTDPS